MIRPIRNFQRAAIDHPHAQSLAGPRGRFSVADTWSLSQHLLVYLQERGVVSGDRVAICSANSEYHLLLWIACDQLGAVFVPLAKAAAPADLRAMVADCAPRLLCSDQKGDLPLDNSDSAVAETASSSGGALGKAQVINLDQLHEQLLAAHRKQPFPPGELAGEIAPVAEGSLAAIIYTSGTSGRPLGVEHSRETMYWAWANYRDAFDYRNSDTGLALAPLSHIGGFNGTTNDIFCHGGKIVVIAGFSPLAAARIIREEQVTIGFAVPTMFTGMLDALAQEAGEELTENPFPHWRRPLIGGAPLPAALARRMEKLQLRPIQVWGMTETGGAGCYLGINESLAHPEAAGRPFTYSQVAVRDADGKVLPAGSQGQVTISGPHVCKTNYPGKAMSAIEGQIETGDIGYIGEDGLLRLSGRASDVIISGGEHVFPAQVEDALSTFPGIGQVAVIGLEDEYWGQRVCAVVTGTATLEDLKPFLTGKLAAYKIPKQIIQVSALPLNSAGKLSRQTLRQSLAARGE
ncbi:MAG: AMP-binding protein [Varibaculum cambriense]|nr:AMP-binding protein [Varibaculum cambriense]